MAYTAVQSYTVPKNMKAKFEARKSFDFDDDLEFCPVITDEEYMRNQSRLSTPVKSHSMGHSYSIGSGNSPNIYGNGYIGSKNEAYNASPLVAKQFGRAGMHGSLYGSPSGSQVSLNDGNQYYVNGNGGGNGNGNSGAVGSKYTNLMNSPINRGSPTPGTSGLYQGVNHSQFSNRLPSRARAGSPSGNNLMRGRRY